jgi:phosphate transport system protein
MDRHFDQELQEFNAELLKLAARTEEDIRDSIEALTSRDEARARRVIARDDEIDEMELKIDEQAIDLIAMHQPVARDLRFLTTGMKINAELERIADLAVDIAQRVLDLQGKPPLKELIDIPRLSAVAQGMVKDAIDAFVNRDIALARRVVLADEEADQLRDRVQDELINDYMAKDPGTATRAVPLLLIARHLERICDHATNVAESVIYMVEGEVVRHHPERLAPPPAAP